LGATLVTIEIGGPQPDAVETRRATPRQSCALRCRISGHNVDGAAEAEPINGLQGTQENFEVSRAHEVVPAPRAPA
jgi:hypothetical protein